MILVYINECATTMTAEDVRSAMRIMDRSAVKVFVIESQPHDYRDYIKGVTFDISDPVEPCTPRLALGYAAFLFIDTQSGGVARHDRRHAFPAHRLPPSRGPPAWRRA